ncbi:MAG: biotin/lipoyl-containing protein [Armatimonadota bacterium]|nr:biotin/lipoyl-binding protein [Armatimonadota bacterium]MCX7778232.1 biotin/lipoyl-binding protein [Armatimonadota bacterium]MDW8024957.1 biotin/lipoyl-containing protein [Armatimonadota bacterium]
MVNIDFEKLRKLVELMNSAQLTELTIRTSEGRITIKRDFTLFAPPPQEQPTQQEQPKQTMITSSWVGTFHRSYTPGGKPLVEVGDLVEEGQVVCVVESLKVPNEIRSPARGIVAQILVDDGQVVEYGQPLMILEPAGE